jgi:hypothetical protein
MLRGESTSAQAENAELFARVVHLAGRGGVVRVREAGEALEHATTRVGCTADAVGDWAMGRAAGEDKN